MKNMGVHYALLNPALTEANTWLYAAAFTPVKSPSIPAGLETEWCVSEPASLDTLMRKENF
jgi:hypothetical protein